MKAISIWNPFALLVVSGFKIFETRTWAAPRSIIGQRVGIASTKVINPSQRAYFESEDFQHFYERLGLPDTLTEMPNGFMLGTATLQASLEMTEELMEDVSDEEQAYGHWEIGNFAWRMTDPVAFETPVPVRGAQGIWNWTAPEEIASAVIPMKGVVHAFAPKGQTNRP